MKSIYVVRDTIPEAWETAVIKCWNEGHPFPTEFDKPEDPNSRDVAALIHVKNPLQEPRIHRAFPGGLDDLEKYRAEVLYGVHDHWIDHSDKTKWQYTYYQRLFAYEIATVPELAGAARVAGVEPVAIYNQFEKVAHQLAKCGHTRRAQMTTWQPWFDPDGNDPPCLQRLWFRIEIVECPTCHGTGDIPHGPCVRCENTGKIRRLIMATHIRSNDAYKAAFMNMHAFIELQRLMAGFVQGLIGEPVEVGDYLHNADSFHIYGSYFDEFRGFLKTVQSREPADRVYTSEFAREFYIDGCNALLAEDDMPENKKVLVRGRKKDLMEGIY